MSGSPFACSSKLPDFESPSAAQIPNEWFNLISKPLKLSEKEKDILSNRLLGAMKFSSAGHPLMPDCFNFNFEFDKDGILRNVDTGETLSLRVPLLNSSANKREALRANVTRLVRQHLGSLGMEYTLFPLDGHPKLTLRVLHSKDAFTHTGPVLVLLQGGSVSPVGVWATRLLLHPNHGLRSGSQAELIKHAHERGYAVVLLNACEHLPNDTEMRSLEYALTASLSELVDDSDSKTSTSSEVDSSGATQQKSQRHSESDSAVESSQESPKCRLSDILKDRSSRLSLFSLLLNHCVNEPPATSESPLKRAKNEVPSMKPPSSMVAGTPAKSLSLSTLTTSNTTPRSDSPDMAAAMCAKVNPFSMGLPLDALVSNIHFDSLPTCNMPQPSTSPPNPSEDIGNDVSPEDCLYGMWRHVIPRLASQQILVWAHQGGGTALIHPFRPMPGLFPGFPHLVSASNYKWFDCGPDPLFRPPPCDVTQTEPTDTTSSGGDSSVKNPMARLSAIPRSVKRIFRPALIRRSCCKPSCSKKPPSDLKLIYRKTAPHRKRHFSANAVLCSSYKVPLVEASEPRGPPKASSETDATDSGEIATQVAGGGLNSRIHPNSSRTMPQTSPSSKTTRSTSVNTAPLTHQALPPLPIPLLRSILPEGRDGWMSLLQSIRPTLYLQNPCPHLKERLATTWQNKARTMLGDLESRVKGIVFSECPAVLDLAMEGVGWGLNLLNDPPKSSSPSVPTLYRPSALRQSVPSRVTKFRNWLVEHAVHYVAADLPVGTPIENMTGASHQIRLLSAGTTEHDLVPSTILKSVFEHFDRMLHPDTEHVLKEEIMETPCSSSATTSSMLNTDDHENTVVLRQSD